MQQKASLVGKSRNLSEELSNLIALNSHYKASLKIEKDFKKNDVLFREIIIKKEKESVY
jgi:hypothetical protein